MSLRSNASFPTTHRSTRDCAPSRCDPAFWRGRAERRAAPLERRRARDALRVGTPRAHPPVHTFLGAPLLFGTDVLGMLGVANRQGGYDRQQEQLLAVFANQVPVAIRNARLYEEQRGMIGRLQQLRVLLERLGARSRGPRGDRGHQTGLDLTAPAV